MCPLFFSRVYYRGLDGGRSLFEVVFYRFDLGFGIDEIGIRLALYNHLGAVSADLPALSVRSCKGSVVRSAIKVTAHCVLSYMAAVYRDKQGFNRYSTAR